MRLRTLRQTPATKIGDMPVWCHLYGYKMKVETALPGSSLLVIAGSAAKVRITLRSWTMDEGWLVDWKVRHNGPGEQASGQVVFTTGELRAAFGLSAESGQFGDELIERFGGESAEQGKYIRWMNYLNIPCPGTGNDGDPNVSIHLDDEMKSAIHKLLDAASASWVSHGNTST